MTNHVKARRWGLFKIFIVVLGSAAIVYVTKTISRPKESGTLTTSQLRAAAYFRSLPATFISVNDRNEITNIASGKSIDDFGAAYLCGLPQLKELYLVESDVSTAGTEHISRIASLQKLTLVGDHIDDACVRLIADRMPNLEDIEIGTQGITNASVVSFSKMSYLKVLSLVSTKVTPSGLNELRERLPHTTIEIQGKLND